MSPSIRNASPAGGKGGNARSGVICGALAAVAALLLTACSHSVDPYEITGSVPEDYRTTNPILIQEKIAVIDIPVSADGARLSSSVRSNVTFFAQQFLASGSGVIAVVAPSGSPNQDAAAAAAVEIEALLQNVGVPAGAISYRVYPATSAERIAPVRLAYNRVAATTTPCGPWTDQASVTAQNRNYRSFGCATQQNLAAMVSNPLDLMYPRGLSPADAARRTDVLSKYRTGDATASAGGVTATGGTQ